MYEVIMPKLGLTMESGTIEKWHKKEGDKVKEGEILFEVMTDKVSLEVEAYNKGILRKILKKEGEDVPVTQVIAYIGEADEEIPEAPAQAAAAEPEKKEEKKVEEPVSASKPAAKQTGGRIKISPLAKKLAKEKGVDYESGAVVGTGPNGRITKEDILKYAESGAAPSAVISEGEAKVKSTTALKGMRKVIAEKMVESKTNIPHILLNVVADVSQLISLRENLKDKILKEQDVKVTYTDFILKICAVALRENLVVNSSLQDNNHIIYDDINVGMAVSVDDGLIVPTIYSCDKLSVVEIAKKRVTLVEKAKKGNLELNEISNGTFTVSNLGMFGIRSFTAVINPPQGGIMAVGEIYEDTAVKNGRIEPKTFMEIAVAVDHRIIDGAVGAKFAARVKELIENPGMMAI